MIIPVVICGVLSMVVGSVWYGPLFGKKWMEICKVDQADVEARKKMQKEAAPLYLLQFALSLFQITILYRFFLNGVSGSALSDALWIWAAFVMPTIAGSAMWNNNTSEVKQAQFLIQSGYQLVMFVIYALVFGFLA